MPRGWKEWQPGVKQPGNLELRHALDDLRNPVGTLVARSGDVLYLGWIYPPSAGIGACGDVNSNHPRSKPSSLDLAPELAATGW